MLTLAIMAVGSVTVLAGWRLVGARRLSVWVAMGIASGGAGLAALATGRLALSPRLAVPWAVLWGIASGLALYSATVAFVLVVRRWPVFDRHVAEIYDQRKGLSLPVALVLASAVIAPGEELFWRGLFQERLSSAAGWVVAAAVTWGAYVIANAASESLPILAGAIVSGAVWGGLALWTHGVLACILCHSVWTASMLARPPGGAAAGRASRSGVARAAPSARPGSP
jgi:uncharacterized protein